MANQITIIEKNTETFSLPATEDSAFFWDNYLTHSFQNKSGKQYSERHVNLLENSFGVKKDNKN